VARVAQDVARHARYHLPGHEEQGRSGMLRAWICSAVLVALVGGPAAGLEDRRERAARVRAAPELSAESWINSDPLTIGSLCGRVAIVEFWTFACRNCQNVEPRLKAWHDEYGESGLVIVGVHTPELPFERDATRVGRYVRDNGILYPVAIDNAFATWKRYDTWAWPTIYVIDKRGTIRHVRVGEGGYAGTEKVIRELLAEPDPEC